MIGGVVLAAVGMDLLSWIGAAILLLALGTSLRARQAARPRRAPPSDGLRAPGY